MFVSNPGAPTTDAFRPPGTVMVMMTVVMDLMNLQSTASLRAAHALETYSPVTMETVYLASTFVMEIMTVLTTQMKIIDINVVCIMY